MASCMPSSVISIEFVQCAHYKDKRKFIRSVPDTCTFSDVFRMHHDQQGKDHEFEVHGEPGHRDIHAALTVGEVVHNFSIRAFSFSCQGDISVTEQLQPHIEYADRKAVDAFQILMAGGRSFPSKKLSSSGKTEGLNRKDELYNKLVDQFKTENLGFPESSVKTEGSYFIQVLCNALWFTTNHQTTINDASKHKSKVLSFPKAFEDFEGYNDIKRNKMKSLRLKSTDLEIHALALYSLLMKPVINSSVQWKRAGSEIKQLADCFSAYSKCLDNQTELMKHYHEQDHPARTIDKDASIEHRHKCSFGVKPIYSIIDEVVRSTDMNQPVFFDEYEHVESPFASNQQRARFFENIQLSVPIDIVKYSPGGFCLSIVCLFQVKSSRTIPEMLTNGVVRNWERGSEDVDEDLRIQIGILNPF